MFKTSGSTWMTKKKKSYEHGSGNAFLQSYEPSKKNKRIL